MVEISRVSGSVFLPLECQIIHSVKEVGGEELGILIGKYLIFVLFCFVF